MKALIVGADHVDSIKQALAQLPGLSGLGSTTHWTGRKVGDERRKIPVDTRLIVVICDRVNHQLLRSVREQARQHAVPMLYTRHSVTEIREKLAGIVLTH